MQQNFIGELENRGKKNIESKEKRIMDLLNEENNLITSNASIEEDVFKLTKEIEGLDGATEKLRTLGNLKGKISQKVSTITKEHKFFTQHTVCPTCEQDIKEEFRVNRISDVKIKQKSCNPLRRVGGAIKKEEERERQFTLK